MEVHNIITIRRYDSDFELEDVKSFVALDIGVDQAKVYEKACLDFISKIEDVTGENISYQEGVRYIQKGVYEAGHKTIYFKTSEDAS